MKKKNIFIKRSLDCDLFESCSRNVVRDYNRSGRTCIYGVSISVPAKRRKY